MSLTDLYNQAPMRRYALRETMLPDGVLIPKGTKVMVSAHQSWDDSIFPKAHEFDGYRFFNMRQNAGQDTAQYVSTASSTLGFGHGRQACPGRFFAANEMKIALSHIILGYDFRLVEGTKPQASSYGLFYPCDGTAQIEIRRRQPEIEL
jgi:cytochrome P450